MAQLVHAVRRLRAHTVFLASPVVFKGRIVQYVGRAMRPHDGKTSIEVRDVDIAVPVLLRAHQNRSAGYSALGFPAVASGRIARSRATVLWRGRQVRCGSPESPSGPPS
jgi:superfamily II DNA or RNA helicase